MVKPADLLNNLKYDTMNSSYLDAKDYLQSINYEVHSLMGKELLKEQEIGIVNKNNISYYIYAVHEISSIFLHIKPSKSWKDMATNLRNSVMRSIANKIEKRSKIFAELESLTRNVPIQEVLKYDIPLSMDYFHYNAAPINEYEGIVFNDRELLIFTDQSSIAVLCMTVSSVLAMGVSVDILATEKVAAVAVLFGSICIDSGIPSDALCVYIVQEKHVQMLLDTSFSKQKIAQVDFFSPNDEYVYNSISGCTVAVTESADLDSAIDMLTSDSTCSSIYPWRTDRLFVQESVYVEFQKRLGKKFHRNSNEVDVNKTLPSGSEVWLYPKKYSDSVCQYIVSGNINLGGKMYNTVTMQAYRSTKELLSLINGESPFALSLWCDSVSVSNEIAYSANTPIVWINMYGMFDPTVSIRVRRPRLTVFGGPMGYANHASDSDRCVVTDGHRLNSAKTIRELTEIVDKLKKLLPSWLKQSRAQRMSSCVAAWTSLKKDYPELCKQDAEISDILNNITMNPVKFSSDVKAVSNKLRLYSREPVGIVCMHSHFKHAIESVMEGNGIIFVSKSVCDILDKFVCYLSVKGVPILSYHTDSIENTQEQALKVHSINSIYDKGLKCNMYNTRIVWSPIGETFAN